MILPIVIPLWGKLVLFSIAKKLTVVAAARIYGFPRLYRKSQHAVRYLCQEPQSRRIWGGRVRTLWRVPDRVRSCHPPGHLCELCHRILLCGP